MKRRPAVPSPTHVGTFLSQTLVTVAYMHPTSTPTPFLALWQTLTVYRVPLWPGTVFLLQPPECCEYRYMSSPLAWIQTSEFWHFIVRATDYMRLWFVDTQGSLIFKYLLSLYVYVGFVLYVCLLFTACVVGILRARGGCRAPLNWSKGQLWVTVWCQDGTWVLCRSSVCCEPLSPVEDTQPPYSTLSSQS